MMLGLASVSTADEMSCQLRVLGRVVRDCEDEDFDRFLAGAMKDLLRSKEMFHEVLNEATTMQALATAFERNMDEITS